MFNRQMDELKDRRYAQNFTGVSGMHLDEIPENVEWEEGDEQVFLWIIFVKTFITFRTMAPPRLLPQ